MNRFLFLLAALPLLGQESSTPQYKVAVIGLVHSHVWGPLGRMIKNEPAQLVGISEKNPALVAEAKKMGAAENLFFDDYNKMLDQTKPDFVWAFVENNRHLEIAKACAARKIHIMFEKPLASTYKDSVAIKDIANKAGIQVMVNYQMAWWPANYVAKAKADSNAIGKVYRLHGIVGHGGPSPDGARNKYFFDWLTDPVQNGAGALMDFGCYNALWSLWYLGRPDTVFATVNHLRPETFPKVEDNATLILTYKNAVGIFEGSWDLPRSFQDLDIFGASASGTAGSLHMKNGSVEMQVGRAVTAVPIEPLAADRKDPLGYMVGVIKSGKPVDGLVAVDINVGVMEIIDAAKESVKTGKPVKLK